MNKKIAFCFLIYNEIINEELWYNFFKNIHHTKYNIYIHSKHKYNLKYFSKYVLNNCIPTEWNTISLVLASNILFTNAFEDPENCKFILVSGSCIPLKNFDYIYNFLTKDDYGHINLFPEEDIFPRCDNLLKYFEKKHINKASQWIILNRNIIKNIIKYGNNNIINKFSNINAPDEHVYITLINYFNLTNEIVITRNVYINKGTTFTNWNRYSSHPKTYENITIIEINQLLNSTSLFARKFAKDCKIIENQEYLCNYINNFIYTKIKKIKNKIKNKIRKEKKKKTKKTF